MLIHLEQRTPQNNKKDIKQIAEYGWPTLIKLKKNIEMVASQKYNHRYNICLQVLTFSKRT